MKTKDLMQMGLRNLWRRKLRTSLTIIGVVIGTFSIIVMVSLGIGMNESFKSQIMEMGSLTTITVNQYYQKKDGTRDNSKPKVLDDKLVTKLKEIPHVTAVTPTVMTSAKLVSGKYMSWIQITGIDLKTIGEFDFPNVQEGGKMLEEKSKGELLLGSGCAYFYNPKKGQYNEKINKPENIIKDKKMMLTFDTNYGEQNYGNGNATSKGEAPMYNTKVVGIMEESRGERDWNSYMDIATLKQYIKEFQKSQGSSSNSGEREGYTNIWVKADNVKYVEEIQDTIKEMELGATSLGDMLKEMQKVSNTLQLVLGGIGAISMIVSAIGIANTMIMSIYERTKEIGVMKVLGCLVSDIQKLFLFEASMIGLMGGIFGVGLSYATSYLINTYGGSIMGNFLGMGGGNGKVSVIPIWLVFLGLGFSVLVGMLSGYYPAKRATKISALEAMKSEG